MKYKFKLALVMVLITLLVFVLNIYAIASAEDSPTTNSANADQNDNIKLAFDRVEGSGAPRISATLPKAMIFNDGDFNTHLENIKDKNQYTITIFGGDKNITVATQKEIISIGVRADVIKKELYDIYFDIGEINGNIIKIQLEVSDIIKNELKLGKNIFGPTIINTASVKGKNRSYFTLEFDNELLKSENQNRALDYDLKYDYWISKNTSDSFIKFKSQGLYYIKDKENSGNETDSENQNPNKGSLNFIFSTGIIKSGGRSSNIGGYSNEIFLSSDNTSDFDLGTVGIGISSTIYPRFDRSIGKLVKSTNSKAINVPPELKFFVEYVDEITDKEKLLAGSRFRLGSGFDWRMEFSENFYINSEVKLVYYPKAPLINSSRKRFSYIEIDLNYKITNNLWGYIKYSDGELAPCFEQDNRATTGIQFDFALK